EPGCATCAWRAKYDERPRSFLGRLWRFHANFCPGWKAFLRSLPDEERRTFIDRYNLAADRFA
nr:hypothetical protein [Thermoanaerobaculales bacterium]